MTEASHLALLRSWSAYTGLGLVPWKMVLLAICLLLFRRLPFVLLCRSWIPAVPDLRQAVFCGWFGPVGVSAVCEYSFHCQLKVHSL